MGNHGISSILQRYLNLLTPVSIQDLHIAVLTIGTAIQGRDCLIQKFRNSSVMLEFPAFRPKVAFSTPALQIVADMFPAFPCVGPSCGWTRGAIPWTGQSIKDETFC